MVIWPVWIIAVRNPCFTDSLQSIQAIGSRFHRELLFDLSLVRDIKRKVGSHTHEVHEQLYLTTPQIKKLTGNAIQARLALNIILGEGLDSFARKLRDNCPKQKKLLTEFIKNLDLPILYQAVNDGPHLGGINSSIEWANFIMPLRPDYNNLLLIQASSLGLHPPFSSMPELDVDTNITVSLHESDTFLALIEARQLLDEPSWLKAVLGELLVRGFTDDHNDDCLGSGAELFWRRYKDPQAILELIDSSRSNSTQWRKLLLQFCINNDSRKELLPLFLARAQTDTEFASALFSSIIGHVSRQIYHNDKLKVVDFDDLLRLPLECGKKALAAIRRMEEDHSVYSEIMKIHPYSDEDVMNGINGPSIRAYNRMLELFLSQHDVSDMKDSTATILLRNLGFPTCVKWACTAENETLRNNSWQILGKCFESGDQLLKDCLIRRAGQYRDLLALLDKAVRVK